MYNQELKCFLSNNVVSNDLEYRNLLGHLIYFEYF